MRATHPGINASRLAFLLLACASLSGCAGGGRTAYYRKNPHALMREVVRCENNGGALASTPHCREVLRINNNLF
ncbi:MAG TPA: hypothetical protein PLV07_04960 [Acidiphilium sp.]|jgi:hypothetical protein|uniref:hypothetical protein n=1 Tax=unclassified Acidiphilium TaxID=2617493 RepID=UPI000BD925AF|nr:MULTISPECIES: hypothetical protein [unclassified Acidiphilium]OYV55132.1 MAG: hypothetical protein B7Z76_11605 [Acidiphilium sp. 20-67-58]OYV85050.1 MAG: hypothetical protein B7Z64_06405 [Acidiphilium sp. 21-68-69]HQT61617.1 hypothetical protein [Acidiphilium sp.]HQU10912.1 hypothetical protein [Acidiphilium sp.]